MTVPMPVGPLSVSNDGIQSVQPLEKLEQIRRSEDSSQDSQKPMGEEVDYAESDLESNNEPGTQPERRQDRRSLARVVYSPRLLRPDTVKITLSLGHQCRE